MLERARLRRFGGGVRQHLTTRTRMTLAYGALATLVATAALVAINLVMRWVPSYEFGPTSPVQPAKKWTPMPAEGIEIRKTSPAKTLEITNTDSLFNTLWMVSIATMVAMVAITMLATWIITGRLLRPLTTLNDAANLAADGHLDHRIDVAGPRDQVTMLAATFNRMLGRLNRQFESHRRFAANASHELRTPLATTKALLQTVRDEDLETPEHARKLIERLTITNQRSIDLVNALLDLADSENVALSPEETDLLTTVEKAVAEVDHLADDHRTALETRLGTAECYADPALVHIIVTNLLTNAIRHGDAPGRVTVETGTDGSYAVVTVTNTGPELTAGQVDEFLAPFSRPRTQTEGHGLGLAITGNLVEANNGDLSLWPREGGGVIARVRLPRHPDR